MEALNGGEQPLGKGAKGALMARAAVAILGFYGLIVVAIVLLLVLLGCEFVVAAAGVRFGLLSVMASVIKRHGALLGLLVRCLWVPKGSEFRVTVVEADAPELFAFIGDLSARLQVRPPRELKMEMNAGAWVHLGGFRRGANATTLGLGYDLVAGLEERELEAVLAHEMTHAKLVRRGFSRWVKTGAFRAGRSAGSLANLAESYRQAKTKFELGEWLLKPTDFCARRAAALVAAYSRQDEFEADRGAAEVCGSAPLRNALLKLDVIAEKTARIPWAERVAKLRDGGLGAWLSNELAGERTETATPFNRYSTHPSTRARLAALPPDDKPQAPGRPALSLFRDPDELGRRLVGEIRRVAALQEKRDSKELKRGLRAGPAGRPALIAQIGGITLMGFGALLTYFVYSAPGPDDGTVWIGVIIVAVGVLVFWLGKPRDRPGFVPSYEAIDAGLDAIQVLGARKVASADGKQPGRTAYNEEYEKLEGALRARLAELPKKKARRRLCQTEAQEGLKNCEFLRAHVGGRLWLELQERSADAASILAVAGAALGAGESTGNLLRFVQTQRGLRTSAARWSAGWALAMLGDWRSAEMFLTAAMEKSADPSTVAAFLARCQGARGKYESAIANGRRALEGARTSALRTWLLVDLMLDAGYLVEAEEVLARGREIGGAATDRQRMGLMRATVRVHLLRRNLAAAKEVVDAWRASGLTGAQAIELGGTYENLRHDGEAEELYRHALGLGHFPAAHLGLGRLAQHRRDRAGARLHALAALDIAKDVGPDGVSANGLFGAILGLLLEAEEPITDAGAWIGRVLASSHGPIGRQSFLIYARDEAHARGLLERIAAATLPGHPPMLSTSIQWRAAPADQVPDGVVKPGIHRYWGE